VHFDSAVVVNETQLPELIQKETHARVRGLDHVGQCVLLIFGMTGSGLPSFP